MHKGKKKKTPNEQSFKIFKQGKCNKNHKKEPLSHIFVIPINTSGLKLNFV